MPGQPVKIGPFVGGMNTYSGPSTISDNEAVELLNLDVDLDGSLLARPGVVQSVAPVTGVVSHILGTYRAITGEVYIIVSFVGSVRAYNTSNATWTTISSVGEFTACVQYNDFLWLVQKPVTTATGGGKWDPTGGYVAVPAMPRGYSACIYKERMFVSASRNGNENSINRVKFCNAANPDTWTSTDYFDVNAGDGDDITKIYVFDSSIVIFKSDSTYIFAYESAPAKGLVQKVSATIGANNAYSVIEYENNLFVMHEANVYRISNWNWEHANIKVPFAYANGFSTADRDKSSLSVLGNRILARYYDNYYVLGVKTGAWSRWLFMQRSNKVVNPQFDTVTTNWLIVAGQATITRDTAVFRSSPASGRLDTVINSTNPYTTTGSTDIAANPGDIWTGSVYVQGAGGASIQLLATDGTNTLATYNGDSIALTGAFQRISVTSPALPVGTTNVRVRVRQTDVTAARSLWLDDAMAELSNSLNSYVVGNVVNTPSEFVSNPNVSVLTGAPTYYAGSYVSSNAAFHMFTDGKFNTDELFSIRLTTKSYDFGPSYAYKRLFWWGADILGNATTAFKVIPNVYTSATKWGQLVGVPFKNLGTWGRPLEIALDVTDSADSSNTNNYRTFIKLLKSLRFRQLQFILEATYSGLNSTAPYRIFSLTAMVDSRQVVSKKVS